MRVGWRFISKKTRGRRQGRRAPLSLFFFPPRRWREAAIFLPRRHCQRATPVVINGTRLMIFKRTDHHLHLRMWLVYRICSNDRDEYLTAAYKIWYAAVKSRPNRRPSRISSWRALVNSIVSMIIAAPAEMAREIVVDVYSPFIYRPINIESKFGLIGEPLIRSYRE